MDIKLGDHVVTAEGIRGEVICRRERDETAIIAFYVNTLEGKSRCITTWRNWSTLTKI